MNKAELAKQLREVMNIADDTAAELVARTYTPSTKLSRILNTCVPLVRWHVGDAMVNDIEHALERARVLENKGFMLSLKNETEADFDDEKEVAILWLAWNGFASSEGERLYVIAELLEQGDPITTNPGRAMAGEQGATAGTTMMFESWADLAGKLERNYRKPADRLRPLFPGVDEKTLPGRRIKVDLKTCLLTDDDKAKLTGL